jgi:hypothetical protein
LKHPDVTFATYKRRQMKHLKQALKHSDAAVATYKKDK